MCAYVCVCENREVLIYFKPLRRKPYVTSLLSYSKCFDLTNKNLTFSHFNDFSGQSLKRDLLTNIDSLHVLSFQMISTIIMNQYVVFIR